MTDIYADFGVNNAVIGSMNITEHEQAMLALPTSVRDGDDTFEVIQEDPKELAEQEADKDEVKADEANDEADEAGDNDEGQEGDFKPLGEPSDELVEASRQIDEYAEGFQQMRAQAIKNGLTEAQADAMEAEFEELGGKLSDKSLEALEKVGYSRGFVRSFLGGQEAITQGYVNQIQAYAGGPEAWAQIMTHLKATAPDSIKSLEAAIERQDLDSIKTLINLGMASRTKKFGKTPERSISKRAPASPASTSKPQTEGYANSREMTAAMSDKRYATDPAYRAQVEAKVIASKF